MFQEYLSVIVQGIPTSLLLTVVSLMIAFFLALFLTFLLSMENKLVKSVVNLYLTLFTGTPLLVQFFLIYAGPSQFQWIIESPLWFFLSNAWFCAALALALNSAAYSTQLFHGAVKAIHKGQWESCAALGLSRLQTLKILIPYALKRALPSYSNEIILVFKGTALTSTITIMDIMGYARQLYGTEYDAITIYGIAGGIYLIITGIATLLLRKLEKKVLAFERFEVSKA
ncbi:arginine transporter permease subunit ArtM [Haemophilus influenzae biotype aegyptius]|uniref:arginine ABC transporter permease ArtM n=1 Tax=Haemophilus influenzae TaxID=727 RepID=UPI0001F36171|nr:arginine ABC transporter permease ArtM [Haemophilus influenzae]QEQ61082.1 arginine ABC transporter permease ArtM [Haemophilus influenzae biotype aegyptius]QEQ63424.1 arginine ABC transporter permease ArtM [Haemophilus influenzae biotype aegyptius]QEQ64644.1 arginine ABC transporter permease ArtM [Haemophilus influenzae biotype aegyptius]TMQ36325.1 arginine transporter permease subunit ArtM [Haemophilus influenzae biotype aegyptius]TMQ38844.1 arginine transporter permease subunit ArtM [Haemo